MRLLNVDTLKFKQFHTSPPPYVIASHRWADEADEITYQDVLSGNDKSRAGYKKLEGFLNFMRTSEYYLLKWLWIDTCCIDKTNAVELSEAINCMFKWYRDADVCLAHLADVIHAPSPEESGWEESFRCSEWFTRGCTLQELLAPRLVVFLTVHWHIIGCKGQFLKFGTSAPCAASFTKASSTYTSLESIIVDFTNIPKDFLLEPAQLESVNAEECLYWAIGRNTTREEDKWYCLFGLLDTPIGANHGEGARRARKRLLAELEDIGSIGKGRAAVIAYQLENAIPLPPTRAEADASDDGASDAEASEVDASEVDPLERTHVENMWARLTPEVIREKAKSSESNGQQTYNISVAGWEPQRRKDHDHEQARRQREEDLQHAFVDGRAYDIFTNLDSAKHHIWHSSRLPDSRHSEVDDRSARPVRGASRNDSIEYIKRNEEAAPSAMRRRDSDWSVALDHDDDVPGRRASRITEDRSTMRRARKMPGTDPSIQRTDGVYQQPNLPKPERRTKHANELPVRSGTGMLTGKHYRARRHLDNVEREAQTRASRYLGDLTLVGYESDVPIYDRT
ncbi:hypothetical protein LTR95_010286 [Oleoguttula sp. CCFEE 5521]